MVSLSISQKVTGLSGLDCTHVCVRMYVSVYD